MQALGPVAEVPPDDGVYQLTEWVFPMSTKIALHHGQPHRSP